MNFICQEEQHEHGRAANVGYMNAAQDIREFQQGLLEEADIDANLERATKKLRGLGSTDDGSAASVAEASEEMENCDMDFTSLSGPSASSPGPGPKREPKRRGRKKHEASLLDGAELEEPSLPDFALPPPSSTKVQKRPEVKVPEPKKEKEIPKTTKSSINKEQQKAEKVLATKELVLNDASLWANRPKHRAMQSAAQALETAASGLLGMPDLEDLMNTMLEKSERAPLKFDLFGRLRSDCKAFIKVGISQDDADVLATVPADVYEQIITFMAMNLLKDLEQAG